jgi:large subunit ribosomal protein L25
MSEKSDKIVLTVSARTALGKANVALRQSGQTPAVMYGHGAESQSISVDSRILEKAYAQAGGNKIIGLKIEDARLKNALFHDVQHDARGAISHVDFYIVRMDEKLKAEVPLHFTGESTAVYQQEGSLIQPIQTIEVEALPADLPEQIEVDISILDDFEKTITVGDLPVPGNVEVLTPADELVAKVEPPRSDEELEALDEEIDEKAEMPEGAVEDTEVVTEDQETRKEDQNKSAGADPAASK